LAVNDAAVLFGESASRVVVSAHPQNITEVLQLAAAAGVPARVIGETGGNRLRFAVGGRQVIDVSAADAERVWSTAIERVFTRRVA
jgi:phosphoribosylformylglycinamidine synthase